ncbi:MAG TPA: GTPase HflX [Planctomycetota bacterium]|jgi:GTP-binding protein HflX|nr:GTPase HflX [Planctomycetota bacterium]
MQELQEKAARAVLVAVQLPNVGDVEFETSLTEMRQLAKTLGFEVVATFTQKRQNLDPGAYVGVGKREEVKQFVRDEPVGDEPAVRRADVLLVDHEISPSQARNLEKEVGCEVMDRTMVILEIFHRHARSREARAQVEIARLSYMAPRLREAAKIAGPQGRQRSGIGGRGSGESQDELDKRKIRDRISELREEIVAMEVERKTQRARRQERQGLARAALVGYTNAGKSTLMRALTGSDVLVADKLFATLDTTVRSLQPESVPKVLVSDTVGFIKNLPHGLVASFKSTLDEALEASLLLHVVDASDPGFDRQIAVTETVLEEIGAKDVPRILVFNKIDRGGDEAALRLQHPGCVVISALRDGDVAILREAVLAFFRRHLVETELFLPWTAQGLRGEIFARCEVLEERADGAGAFFRVRGERDAVEHLRAQASLV